MNIQKLDELNMENNRIEIYDKDNNLLKVIEPYAVESCMNPGIFKITPVKIEKDKTLNEIIDWCENQRRKILADIEPAPGEDAEEAYADLESVIRSDNPIIKYSNDLLDGSEAFVYGVIMQARLLDHIIDHCRSMLGYSGTMPSEVPNQSEDAKE